MIAASARFLSSWSGSSFRSSMSRARPCHELQKVALWGVFFLVFADVQHFCVRLGLARGVGVGAVLCG
jgi:hypothetical protein